MKMNNLEQNSNLINKTYTVSNGSDYINFSARGADLILIPSQSFTNYAMVHNCVDIDDYGITIPYEYASMVGYSYQNIYDYIKKAIEEHLQNSYPHCNKCLLESFIEDEIIKLLDFVCDNNDTDKYLFKSFNVQATTKRLDDYIKRSTKSIVFSYTEVQGGFIRKHNVKIFDNYNDAIKYFDEQVNNIKNKEWYQRRIKSIGNDVWLTDKRHEFAFEDSDDGFGSHYFRLDF